MQRAAARWGSFVLTVGIWAALGCGPTHSPPRPREAPAPECVPLSCQSASATCGTVPDGCGGTVECGSCREGSVCSDRNQCVAQPCSPVTCDQAAAACGKIPDRCGGELDCGGCSPGQRCGGGGAPNTCGTGACVPRTCADALAQCGEVDDGCGGKLACGTCAAGERCGYGGRRHVCGAVTGGIRFHSLTAAPPKALALDGTGGAYGLVNGGAGLELVRVSAAGVLEGGVLVASKSAEARALAFHEGALYAAWNTPSGGVVTKLATDGRVRWSRDLGGAVAAVHVQEGRIAAVQEGGESGLRFWDLNGTWLHEELIPGVSSFAWTADGGYLIGGSLPPAKLSRGPFSDRTGNGEAFLVRYGRAHAVQWTRVFEGAAAKVTGLSLTSQDGFIASLRIGSGTVAWAGTRASAGTLLISAAPNGSEVNAFAADTAAGALTAAAGDEVTVLWQEPGCARIEKRTHAGRPLWSDALCGLEPTALAVDPRSVWTGGARSGGGFFRSYGP